jgi:hypothetical protein
LASQFPTDQYQSANTETAFHITNLQLRGILGGLFAVAASHSRLVSAPKYSHGRADFRLHVDTWGNIEPPATKLQN